MTEEAPEQGRAGRWRHAVPVLLGLGLFVLGVVALFRMLRPVRAEDIFAQVHATPWATLAGAGAATFLAYVALIGYDWSALRYLGRKIPLRIVAVGGFLGYSFGNTVGVAILSGGAVRYRIYSAFGLNAFEVATVSTFVALAFGFGITVVGLGALALQPDALASILPLSAAATRLWSLAGMGALVGGLAWLSFTGKTLRIRGFELSAPSPGILFGQLGFTLADTAMAALTLYLLLPPGAPDFVPFLALFSAAVMIGVLSHVPGGVGVFETAVLAAMPADVPLEHVAAALLLYRVIYYFVPFGLALAFVAMNEARLAGGAITRLLGDVPEPLRPVLRSAISAAPALAGLTAFGLGSYLLLASLMPSVRPDEIAPDDLLAAILLEGGAILSAVLGVLLLILSQGLARRVSGAFWLTQVALAIGAVAALLNGRDVESALLLFGTALVLAPFRREFHRSARLTRGVFSPGWVILVAGLVAGATTFFFFMHEVTPYSIGSWIEFSSAANTPRALRAGLAASALLLAATVWIATQPARAHSRAPTADALDRAADIIARQDDPGANLALSGDKALFFSDGEDAFVMYATRGNRWIALGDPVGPDRSVASLSWAFLEEAYGNSARPILHQISDRYLSLWVEMGFSVQKIGDEAVVRLPGFSLYGTGFEPLRHMHARAQQDGLRAQILDPPHDPALFAELKAVADAQPDGGAGREAGFSVGRFDPGYLGRFPVAVIRREGRAVAFASLLTAGQGRRVAIDLLRYLPGQDAQRVMAFLFTEAILHFRQRGAQEFSLGLAPLPGFEARRGTRLWNRFGAVLFRHGGAFPDFESLRAFKQTFRPEWRARHIAVPPGVLPLVALRDVAMLIAADASPGRTSFRRR